MSPDRQITDTILMIRPAHFGYNEETATNNAFQVNDTSLSSAEVRRRAVDEFDALVDKLRSAGVKVIVVEDTDVPVKSDAVFPNNWVTFHADGAVITYPMYSPIRRQERREDIIEELRRTYLVGDRIHLEEHELVDRFLEGTGSLILDRPNRIAYACLSERTDPGLLEQFRLRMGYEKVAFTAVDGNGKEIYHTNVMMALGETVVVICLESVPEEAERTLLLEKFAATGKEIIEITLDQMMAFAGNMLQVRSETGDKYLVMSERAFHSLTPTQIRQIEKHARILHSSLDTIETYGGGSARCMMAEVFLEHKS